MTDHVTRLQSHFRGVCGVHFQVCDKGECIEGAIGTFETPAHFIERHS